MLKITVLDDNTGVIDHASGTYSTVVAQMAQGIDMLCQGLSAQTPISYDEVVEDIWKALCTTDMTYLGDGDKCSEK